MEEICEVLKEEYLSVAETQDNTPGLTVHSGRVKLKEKMISS
jgi:hypothetical protein